MYAALSPYLNGTAGVTSTQPAPAVAATPPVAATTSVATPAPAPIPVASPLPAPAVDTTPPYLNPAIPLIAAAASVWPIGFAIYGLPVQPAVPPVAPVSAYPRVGRVESGV